jgi:hypothetical protein
VYLMDNKYIHISIIYSILIILMASFQTTVGQDNQKLKIKQSACIKNDTLSFYGHTFVLDAKKEFHSDTLILDVFFYSNSADLQQLGISFNTDTLFLQYGNQEFIKKENGMIIHYMKDENDYCMRKVSYQLKAYELPSHIFLHDVFFRTIESINPYLKQNP